MVYLRVGDELLPTDAMGVCSTATILILAEEMFETTSDDGAFPSSRLESLEVKVLHVASFSFAQAHGLADSNAR